MTSSTYSKVVAVISKPPELRQDFEIQGLLLWLRKKSQLFSKLKTDYLKDIVRNCGLVTYNKDDIIIKQGERGDCFYIILEGKISIFIINKDKDAEGEDDRALEMIGSRTPDGDLDRTKLGNFVTHLESGVPFGEVALMSDDCIRTASIIAEEKTDLLVVDRDLYNRAVKFVLKKEFEEKAEFIKNNPLFSMWAPRYRKQLTMALYKETFPYDSVMVRQGEKLENIYFVIRGQVEIQIDASHHHVQYPRIFEKAQDETDKLIRRHQKIRPPTEAPSASSIRRRDTTKNSKLCLLGINESVGEIEVLLDLPTYMQTAVCTERTDVLVLEMKHYERLFVKRHPRTIESMRDILAVKLDTRMNMCYNKDEIPFLVHLQDRIQTYRNPKPLSDKKKKPIVTVSEAEKEFLNHKGPLIDPNGPGSVFFMIRVREKTKLRLKAHKERLLGKQGKPDDAHVHAVRLPQTLVMAAQMSGATRDDVNMEEQPAKIISHRLHSARSLPPPRVPRSFRRIQSATKTVENDEKQKSEESNDHENGVINDDSGEDFETARSLPDTRHGIVNFPDIREDMHLASLEARVRDWLDKNNNTRGATQVAQLRRLPLQELEAQPKPGNKVIIRRRARSNLTDSHEVDTRLRQADSPTEHFKILIA